MTEDTSAAVNQPDNLADLRPKMRLRGTVSSVELFGVLVDVGVGRDGLLHISELNEKKGKAAVRAMNKVLKGEYAKAGVEVKELSAGQRAAFKKATSGVRGHFLGKTSARGKELLRQHLLLLCRSRIRSKCLDTALGILDLPGNLLGGQ